MSATARQKVLDYAASAPSPTRRELGRHRFVAGAAAAPHPSTPRATARSAVPERSPSRSSSARTTSPSPVSDSSGGLARTFPSLSAAANEAGRSRVVGGIHFEFSNQAGLLSGRGVATEVLGRKLPRKLGPTHVGMCPL